MFLKEECNNNYKEDKMIIDNNEIPNNNSNYNNFQNIIKRVNKDDISSLEKLKQLLLDNKNKLLEIFEIKEFLDSGSESLVYKVLNKNTQKPFVLKFIFNKYDRKRNINEFNILNKLKNINIISSYGITEILKGELDCVIMEYGKLGNIKSFMRNKLKRDYLSESLLCYFTCQILNGLIYCHKCNICHFDIKPQNIIIDEFLNAKIIDFSISLDYQKIKTNKIQLTFRGTNAYMAPEVIITKIIDKNNLNKIDLYSLGVTLYFLAFGKFPYDIIKEDTKYINIIYNKIQNNKLEFYKEEKYYSLVFIDFLQKILEKDINKRINIYEAFNHPWIKGGNILLEEKEKISNISNFLIYLMTNHFFNFIDYLKEEEKKFTE